MVTEERLLISLFYGISIASAGSVRSKPVLYLSVCEPTMESGAEYWIRTSDPLLVRQML